MSPAEHPDAPKLRQYLDELKHAPDIELICHSAGWKEQSFYYQGIKLELERRAKRREQRVAWAAIGVSLVSLLVSVLSAWHVFGAH